MTIIVIKFIIFLFYLIQRLSEIYISKRNETYLIKENNGIEKYQSQSKSMKFLHSIWFLLILIFILYQPDKELLYPTLIIPILFILQLIRFYSIKALKKFWIIKIFKFKKFSLYSEGLYQYIRHPNYLVVIIEIFLIPILYNQLLTGLIFFILNLILILDRIKKEEEVLCEFYEYQQYQQKSNKLIPFIY